MDASDDNVRLFGKIERRRNVSINRFIGWSILYGMSYGVVGSLVPMMSSKLPHSPLTWALAFGLGGVTQAIAQELWDIPRMQSGLITIVIFYVMGMLLVYV